MASTLSAEARPEARPAVLPQAALGGPPPDPPPAGESDRPPALGADEKVEAKKVEPLPIVAVMKAERTPIAEAKVEAPRVEAKEVEPAPIAEAKVEAPRVEAEEAERAPIAEAKVEAPRVEAEVEAASADDAISVPPVDVADDERFFSEGDLAHHLVAEHASLEALTVTDKRKRKSEPAVVERRARFARYVRWAVAGAAVVCLVAVGRTLLSSSAPSTAAPRARPEPTSVAASAPPAVTKAAETAAAPAAAEPLPEPASAEPAPATSAEPAPTASAEPAPAASAEPAPAASAAKPEPPSGDAKAEKAKARTLLEKRKLAEAIEAGERSVALDPTDGEAWLILGAAFQEKGDNGEARRAYASCVKEAKSGPRHECAKLLR